MEDIGPVLYGHSARVWDCCISDSVGASNTDSFSDSVGLFLVFRKILRDKGTKLIINLNIFYL